MAAATGAAVTVVRDATRDDIEPVAAMLARAFADEPFHQWLFPKPAGRAKRARRLFRCEVRNMLRDGVVLVSDDCACASLWGPPDKPQGGWWSQLVVFVTLVQILGSRTAAVLNELDEVGSMRPAEPHWYLSVLGTDPAQQGRGMASALLERALARCDQEQRGAWLETASSERTGFYRRFGFREKQRIQLDNGPPIIGMWRPSIPT
ncbi:MAG: GNAT family N-acetyltransferase [Gammaproteobacteria bacterium]|nr:GNAT family N-acetyltransferase [Gammaproteobacteria bacterium]